ncbi:MAG: DNA polymerase III subunit epsilon [Gammaproteobacteria bacterium]|nr:DNA polymerase III subunit epsilon [Gammaproteobacteria bacterium]
MRQIVLDTETTGLEPEQGHRIIEIGCVELINRRLSGRHFHQYLRPDRQSDAAAFAVHGISDEVLADKPPFSEIAEEFLAFIDGAELIIHNAPFDVGFLDHEIGRLGDGQRPIDTYCRVLDTLALARELHPGQRNSLDALCKRYAVDNSARELHGALLDAEILAEVYLAMTGGQATLDLSAATPAASNPAQDASGEVSPRGPLRVIRASDQELDAHRERLRAIDESSDGGCIWRQLESD